MKRIFFLLIFLFGFTARADLLERFHLETALQDRLQAIFKIYDGSAKVLVHLEYKNFQGKLPGANIGDVEHVAPDHIESMDILKASIDIYTSLDEVPEEAKEALRTALPIKDKKKIDLKINKYDTSHVNTTTKPVEVKDLAGIVREAIDGVTKIAGIFLGACLFLFFIFIHFQNTRRTREMRDQFRFLAAAIGEAGGGGGSMPSFSAQKAAAAASSEPSVHSSMPGDKPFEHWPVGSIKELMADAYWCDLDGYAHWLWKEFSSSQKYELLNLLPFLKDYCAHFVEVTATPQGFHEHPYYLEPQNLATVSQEDLGRAVKKDIGLWHIISPMRRQGLPFNLQEKVEAVQSSPSKADKMPSSKSSLRTLETKPAWGDITSSDELVLYENPDMVPIQMRKHIRSLVWLAKKDTEYVRQVLAKYDARSLASAWVGPDDILKVLESGLPEKKLKLLQTYKSKMEPSRTSEVYQILVEEGLSDEAA